MITIILIITIKNIPITWLWVGIYSTYPVSYVTVFSLRMVLAAFSTWPIVSSSRFSVTSISFSASSFNTLDLKQHLQLNSIGLTENVVSLMGSQSHLDGLVYSLCKLSCVKVMLSGEFVTLTFQHASFSSVSVSFLIPRVSNVSDIHSDFSGLFGN